jgi:cytochrome c553
MRMRALFTVMLLALPTAALASPRTLDLYEDALSLTPAPKRGAQLYQHRCASCHGKQALGSGEKVIPSLAGQLESYLLKELVDFVELDRDTPEMHRLMATRELGKPQAWRDLAAYLAQLAPNEQAQVGNGNAVIHGARAYADYCAQCHGEAGEGMEQGAAPALRSQHYSYLLLQLRSFDTDHRLNIEPPLQDSMVGLNRDDLEAIADYLSRLLPSARRTLTVTR